MTAKAFAFIILLCIETLQIAAQVKIGAVGTPHPSAVLELDGGGTKGILMPKVTAVQRGNLPSPAQGLLVYQTDGVTGFYVNRSGIPGTPNWSLLGEGGTFWQSTVFPNNVINTNSGSVGIGSGNISQAKFMVKGVDGDAQAIFGVDYPGISIESNSPLVGFNNYYKDQRLFMSTGYSGSLRMDHNSGNFIFTSNGTGSGGTNVVVFNTLATLTQTGRLGIGVLPALAGLQVEGKVGAVNALFGSNTSGVAIESSYPGIGFNSYFNGGRKAINTGFGSLIGQDPNNGRFYIMTSSASVTGQGTAMPITERFNISATGNIGIEGNTDPKAPLSFLSSIGNKIALWGDASTPHYGLGIQGALMQLYTNGAGADISMGYGSSGAFTEKYRFGNNGYLNINNGRIRFTGQVDAGNPQGIEFTNLAGDALRGYIGQFDNNQMGFYGYPGAGWSLLFNQTTGQLNLGATRNPNDITYKLNVGGKILAEEIRVQLQSLWPDYVFKSNYRLMPLNELHDFVRANEHLPGIPKATEMDTNGLELGEMQRKMVEKIEELTLYILELKREVDALKAKIK